MHEIQNEPRGPGIPTDASAVEALVGMIKSWEESGFLQDESSQKEADYLDDVLKSNLSQISDEASIRELPHAAARLQKSLSLVVPTLEKFRQLVLLEVERATRRLRGMSLMCGMALLTNDILSNIFDIAVRESGAGIRSATSAIQLARVSKRFRSVALSNHSLWSFIYGETNFRDIHFSQVKLCLERSAQAPIQVMYNALQETDGTPAFNRFINAVLPHVGRWKSFTLEFRGRMEPSVKVCNAIAELETVCAPNLEKLGILSRFPSRSRFSADVPIPFSKWDLPNLQDVELQDFSLDANAFPSLKRVSETVCIRNFAVKSFFVDLMALNSLRYLYLGLVTDEFSQDHPRLDLPSLTELSLYLRVKYTKPFDVALTALNCPNVTDLSVKLLYMLDDEDDWGENKKDVTQDYIRHLFAFPGRFQKVSSLTLTVTLSECVDADEGDLGHALYAIPLPHLPSLRHLSLQGTLASLRPQKNKLDTQVFEIEEKETYPAIETISVRTARPDRLHDWLAKIMKKLEVQGDWERRFNRLQVILQGRHRTASGVVTAEVEYFPRSCVGEWISSSVKSSSG